MSKWSRSLGLSIAAGLVFLLTLGWLSLYAPALQDWLLPLALRSQVSRQSALRPAPTGLKVLLCGTSGPPASWQRAKTCTLVMAGKHTFVVDVGPGSANRLGLYK